MEKCELTVIVQRGGTEVETIYFNH